MEIFDAYSEFTSTIGILISGIITIMLILCPFVIWITIIKTIINSCQRKANHNFFKNNVIYNYQYELNSNNKKNNIYKDVTKTALARFNTDDIDSLKDFFYNKFLEFENAYNNLDYNAMKILSTKQLFQNYYTGISLDLKIGKKRIIKDIEKKKVILFEIDSTIVKQVASLMIEISYINYMLNKNGYVISGNRENKVTEKFEVIFRKDFSREEITKCPNCGAAITGNKCDYCRSIIKNEDFKISSIKKIIDN